MEEVEETNRAAMENCHRVLSLISKPQYHDQYRNLMVETGEAVSKFKRTVILLSVGIGLGLVRKIFLENPNPKADSSVKPLQLSLQLSFPKSPVREMDTVASAAKNRAQIPYKIFMDSPTLELGSASKNPLPLAQQTPPTHYQILQHYNNSINLKFDNSNCTATMSSNRSFISSLSMDGTVSNLDVKAFHLIRAPQSSNRNSQQTPKRRCFGRGEDGSMKCGSSGRCHCSKRMKLRVKSIKVPTISNKLADEYSWRKYAQKPIKGSPHPRYICLFPTCLMILMCIIVVD
uniref:WRKY domain-containing protein n=1 Tax=Nelumbo nucifera TaxID=4432 RepID=A0A822Z577_NELNU|nr:TPA_asm: hypothetical protein HUJ06_007319 [Nelumbo nucifera]